MDPAATNMGVNQRGGGHAGLGRSAGPAGPRGGNPTMRGGPGPNPGMNPGMRGPGNPGINPGGNPGGPGMRGAGPGMRGAGPSNPGGPGMNPGGNPGPGMNPANPMGPGGPGPGNRGLNANPSFRGGPRGGPVMGGPGGNPGMGGPGGNPGGANPGMGNPGGPGINPGANPGMGGPGRGNQPVVVRANSMGVRGWVPLRGGGPGPGARGPGVPGQAFQPPQPPAEPTYQDYGEYPTENYEAEGEANNAPWQPSPVQSPVVAPGAPSFHNHPKSFAPDPNPRAGQLSIKAQTAATTFYSTKETAIVQDILKLLVTRVPGSLQFLYDCVSKAEQAQFAASIINLSFGRQITVYMLQELLYDEFATNCTAGKEILRENGTVIQFMKAYLKIAGKEYLKTLLKEIVNQICVTEKKVSFEIDPLLVDPEEIKPNFQNLVNKLDYIIGVLTSRKMIDLMPPGIRICCQTVSQLSNQFKPTHTNIYIGSFLLLRYINPALFTPETSGLLPVGKAPPPISRRNLILITKILQNISNGLQFSKKEAFMSTLSLDDWRTKIYDWFSQIIDFPPVEDPTDKLAVKVELGDLHVTHSVLFETRAELSNMVSQALGPQGLQEFNSLLDQLGAYSLKQSFEFKDPSHKQLLANLLKQKNDESSYIGYVDVSRGGKQIGKVLLVNGLYGILICDPVNVKVRHHLGLPMPHTCTDLYKSICAAAPPATAASYSHVAKPLPGTAHPSHDGRTSQPFS